MHKSAEYADISACSALTLYNFQSERWFISMNNDIVLSMPEFLKFFRVNALQDVDFTLCKGEIHALMEKMGQGKSTLVKVLTGVYQKDSGSISVDGINEISIKSPQEAQSLGISTVYQEITLCPNLTVAENMFIGRGKYHFVNWRDQEKKANEILKKLNIPTTAKRQLGTCSLAVQQMVAIARAVDMECKILILDEPTSSLNENSRTTFSLTDLKKRNVGIVFITHFLEQVYAICDRITVLRNGELIGEYEVKELPRVELISKMIGKKFEGISELKNTKNKQINQNAPIVYEASGLSSTGGVKPFDFKIHKGEINGFTGLLGSGRSESVRAIFGADRVLGGKVKLNGKQVKITKPRDAMENGIGYLPEDRKLDGIIADLSVRENIILALQVLKGFFRPFSKKEAESFAKVCDKNCSYTIKSLVGNQQKLYLHVGSLQTQNILS